MSRPSNTVSFLFTDIEGSTRLWEASPERMALALGHHDRACRDVVREHGGRIVKMTGDGMYAAFADPAAALKSALGLQRRMADIGRGCGVRLDVRCGLHAGKAEERDGDYFGTEVIRAARVMGAAHGGQVLLTQAIVDPLQQESSLGVSFLHLGKVRLRDLASPLDVWQLQHTDLREAFPPLRSLDATPNNLPRQVTTFIGREDALAESKSRLEASRLVTFTGAGGCGKSRLALQVAADVLESFPDGAWLVELAPLTDPQLVPKAIAGVLGVVIEGTETPGAAIERHLAARQVLLVLDNAEHLLTDCAQFVDAVLRRCAGVKIIVTSREALGIPGEAIYRVPSLTVPEEKDARNPGTVVRSESARLFVERVQAHFPAFAVSAANAAAVVAVCRRLDGIPLAIELAAARLRTMTVEELEHRLDQCFRLLTGGSRTALPRQQTLRATIDWSYTLLSPVEREFFSSLSVFADGWSLEAAEQVSSSSGIDSADVLDLHASLSDKSLLVVEDRAGVTRYRLLETIRQYARDRLVESGGVEAVRGRHLAYFCGLARAASPNLHGPAAGQWLDRLELEHGNLRAAMNWALTEGADANAGLRLAQGIVWFWFVRGHYTEGRDFAVSLLAANPAADTGLRANVTSGAGILANMSGDRDGARTLYESALELNRAAGNRIGLARAYGNLGMLAADESNYVAAREMYEKAIPILREEREEASLAATLVNLGNIFLLTHDYAAARGLYEEALVKQRELGDQQRIATSLNNLGSLARLEGDHAASQALFRESLQLARLIGDRRLTVSAIQGLAKMALDRGVPVHAALLFACSQRIVEELGYALSDDERDENERYLERLREAVPEEALARAWHEGRAMDVDDVLRMGAEPQQAP